MKILLSLILALTLLNSCRKGPAIPNADIRSAPPQIVDSTGLTNNFFDNVETISLPLNEITIGGEISNPGVVDFTGLPKHQVIVKEVLTDDSGVDKFVGAYCYYGYSLLDILDRSIINKSNAEEFQPVIDLYVEIENEDGQKVVFSWGEIYYPNNLHKIILVSDVARIVPSKTRDLWVLPHESKVVSGNDLITERNISSPVKITVRSYADYFKAEKGLSPMFSDGFGIFKEGKELIKIETIPSAINIITYNSVFYGRGKGIHSTSSFSGVFLKSVLEEYFPCTRINLMTGLFCLAAKDGYRMTVSYSELMNRNDQQEFLLIKTLYNEDGGLFRIFPGSDFFSDRAIKSLSEIHFINIL